MSVVGVKQPGRGEAVEVEGGEGARDPEGPRGLLAPDRTRLRHDPVVHGTPNRLVQQGDGRDVGRFGDARHGRGVYHTGSLVKELTRFTVRVYH